MFKHYFKYKDGQKLFYSRGYTYSCITYCITTVNLLLPTPVYEITYFIF